MGVSDGFLEYVIDQLSGLGTVTARRMFGGAGLYSDGLMFGLVADDVAYLKSDDMNREDFIRAGSKPFMPFPEKGKSMVMPYYEIPPEILENPDDLAMWARRSLSIQKRRKAR